MRVVCFDPYDALYVGVQKQKVIIVCFVEFAL